MSLINKMLQDLDARGGHPGPADVSSEIKTVLAPERKFPWLRVALLGGLAAVLGASGFVAWRMQQGGAVSVTAAAAQVAPPATAPTASPAAAPEVIAPVQSGMPPLAVPAPVPAEPEALVAAPEPKNAAQARPPEAAPTPVKKEAPARRREAGRAEPEKTTAAAKAPAKRETPAKTAAASAAPARPAAGRVETSPQRAENGYRRALASLEEGRVSEAIGHLQGALRADPRHEASRQTLVSLLIEAKRPDEAIRQLQAALALDARQPALAMLLARLQIERGGPAIDTLLRTLPSAAGNGEYHAFLAGALQREGRHRESVEHYQAALRTSPQNGVWWMGLGISLQGEKRDAEAADAFGKARSSGTLSPELQSFVDRKLKQLAR